MTAVSATGVEWRLLPRFLIRGTGFAFDLLDRLRLPATEQAGLALVDLQATVDARRADFERGVFPTALEREQRRGAPPHVFRAWYGVNQRVRKQQVCPERLRRELAECWPDGDEWLTAWNDALNAVEKGRADLEAILEGEFPRAHQELRAIVDDERFQEALLLSNPNMYTVALPSYLKHAHDRTSKTRYLERQLFAYVQRFCAKNDTTSFFGPVDYGDVVADEGAPMTFAQTASGAPQARLTRLSYWAVQALADTIAAVPDVGPWLVPRLVDGCALLEGDVLLVTTTNQRIVLPAAARQLLERIGEQTARELCRSTSESTVLDALVERGLVTLQLQVPTSEFNPLAWLIDRVRLLPDECAVRAEWLAQLLRLRLMLDEFASTRPDGKLELLGNIEALFEQLTGLAPRRGQGATYADRLVLYDEAQGDVVQCTVGAPLARDLVARLTPALDLCASYSALVRDVSVRRARSIFEDASSERPLPYLAFVRALESQLTLEMCLDDPEVVEFQERLTSIARSRYRDDVVRLSADDVAPLLRSVPAGSLISPDVFLAAPDTNAIRAGAYDLVIGEIHYGAQVWCHFLTFDDDRAVLNRALNEAFQPGEPSIRASLVHRRQQGKTFNLELPGVSVEVLGRSTRAREHVLPVADLEVVQTVNGVELRSRSRGLTVELYPGDPRAVTNWLFGTPPMLVPALRWGTCTPRVMVGDATLWRASWQLPTSALLPSAHPTASEFVAHACAVRRRFGLPQRCFARVASERKPLYVDFANLFSLELLAATARDDDTVHLTEMLPTVDQWWLRRPGGAHSCEWRTTLVAHRAER